MNRRAERIEANASILANAMLLEVIWQCAGHAAMQEVVDRVLCENRGLSFRGGERGGKTFSLDVHES